MNSEDIRAIIAIIIVIDIACSIVAGFILLVHLTEIDYDESCMREMAVNHCATEGLFMNAYSSGTLDTAWFYCFNKGRGEGATMYDYSDVELDYCRTKDKNALKHYESKWEIANNVNAK